MAPALDGLALAMVADQTRATIGVVATTFIFLQAETAVRILAERIETAQSFTALAAVDITGNTGT